MKIESKYQTIWQRIAAELIDLLLFVPLLAPSEFIVLRGHLSGLPGVIRAFLFFPAASAYQIVIHARYGQTLGKMVTNIKLIDVSGAKLRLRQALLRPSVNISLYVASFMINAPLIWRGLIPSQTDRGLPGNLYAAVSYSWDFLIIASLFISSKRRTVADFIAGSVIVRTQPQRETPGMPEPGMPEKKEKAPLGTMVKGIMIGVGILLSVFAMLSLMSFFRGLFSQPQLAVLGVSFLFTVIPGMLAALVAFFLFRKALTKTR